MHPLHQIASLIQALDSETRRELLSCFSEEERSALEALQPAPEDECTDHLAELSGRLISSLHLLTSLDDTNHVQFRLPPDRAEGSLPAAKARQVATIVRHEHPQMVAALLSGFEAATQQRMIACLPDDLQDEVRLRIASIEAVDPRLLHELHCELLNRLTDD